MEASRKKRPLLISAITAVVAFIVYVAFQFAGSVVVLDPERQVASARIIAGNDRTQPLHRLPFNVFYAQPRLEGEVEIRCRNDTTSRVGYVTPHLHVRFEVKPDFPCQLAPVR
jgi:hypothetical protein